MSNKVQVKQHPYVALDFAPQLRKNQPMTDSIRALLASNEGSQQNESKHDFESTDQPRENAAEHMYLRSNTAQQNLISNLLKDDRRTSK